MSNGLWADKPFARGQAWLDILLNTSYEKSSFWVRGIEVAVLPGQCAMSTHTMAKRWGWSRKKVTSFLKHLEKELQIEPQKSNVTTLITITKWEEYQQKEPQKAHQKNRKGTTEEPIKEVKKERTQTPGWIDSETWQAFEEMRKKLKAPMTEKAKTLAFNKLDKFRSEGHDVNEIINDSIMNGWKSFYPGKGGSSGVTKNNTDSFGRSPNC
jgi:hypothetical protein